MSLILRCNRIQRDRRGFRHHLLWEHNEVSRRGFDVPVRLEGKELAAVWVGVRCHQAGGTTKAARRREELGLPRVSDREAQRRLQDNQARSAQRHRAAARARGAAQAALGTQPATTPEQAGRIAKRLGTFQARPLAEPPRTVKLGGSRRPRSPCPRCIACPCQTNRDFSTAQDPSSPTPRRSTSPRRPPTPRRPHTRSPKRDPSPGPPQLSREEAQPQEEDGVLILGRRPEAVQPGSGKR